MTSEFTSRVAPACALPEVRWASAALALFLAGCGVQLSGGPTWMYWTLYLGCYATGGWKPAVDGLLALRSRTLEVDLLMIVAALGAAAIGQILDGALLIVIFASSGALEAVATRKTEESVRGLLDLAPTQATRLGDGGREETIDTDRLEIGNIVLIRPGERIGADGEVIEGISDVDQSSITGESEPARKTKGQKVFSGTLNGTGALTVRVESDPSRTVIARIVTMVEEASATKATTQLFVEKIEQRYSVGMVVATLALFVVPLAWGAEFEPTLLRAMTFMIVASPCAVVLATMPPLLAAIANAGRHGVLVKSSVVMEQLGNSTIIAFDKTGTLTGGVPRLTDVRVLDDSPFTADRVLALAASAEQGSEHPLGRAIVAAAREREGRVDHATGFNSTPGVGVSAIVGGLRVEVTRPGRSELPAAVGELETAGLTAVLVAVGGETVGVLGLTDRPRVDAAATVAAVTSLTGNGPVMLTGDNSRAAKKLAGHLGIDDVRSEMLPRAKMHAVRQLTEVGHHVLLVGDGVNDAPAMAAAGSSIAMGRAGSDLALDTADAVVLRDELSAVPALVALSRRARRLVLANLVIAGTFIVALVSWDVIGSLPLPLAVAGHEGSTVIVALNGLRLLRESAWEGKAGRVSGAEQ
ncbi:heavy metal translocating P-type ATPase [Rhodococcus sp. 27YEA15]|uniref:heavy metal translocating P-type ATPase n=1 Tax=Rhodococcus sp. 27YEA15 TaxID=3156259 RepID=UPI003C7B10D4